MAPVSPWPRGQPWGVGTGLHSEDLRDRGYAPRGGTPEVRVDHKRASLDLISAVTTRGELRWMVLDGAVKAPSLLRLLDGLVLDAEQKVSLILDRLPVHRSTKLGAWLAGWGVRDQAVPPVWLQRRAQPA